jgi:hypothetical protein
MATGSEMQDYFNKIGEVVKPVGQAIAAGYRAATRDGVVDAFLRQGANEIGAALKAFPDSTQIDEPGQVFNPLQSDIAADKRAAEALSPGDLAEGKGVSEQLDNSQKQTQRQAIRM